MRGTIRHDRTGRCILAYLALYDRPVKTAQVVTYMALMHYAAPGIVRQVLRYHTGLGMIEHVRRGWYQRKYEVMQ